MTPERKSPSWSREAKGVATLLGGGAVYVGTTAPLGVMSGPLAAVLVVGAVGLVAWAHRCTHPSWVYPGNHNLGDVRYCPHCERTEPWQSRHQT